MFSLEQYRAVRDGSGVLDRSARSRLRLTGSDRKEYLQGLLTNDIVALTPGAGCYAALLTAQGRMISDMYVVEAGDAILMDLEPAFGEKVFAHLERFIFSEDVQVANETTSRSQIGVYGPAAASVVSSVIGDAGLSAADLNAMTVLGNRTLRWRDADVLIVRRDDVGIAGFDLVIDAAQSAALIAAVRAAGAIEIDSALAETFRVEAAVPRFGHDMDEDTIPLEAGIEDRAISMTKGCYVGQEIIVRVLHRGHGRVARKLVLLRIDGADVGAVPQKGDRVHAADRDIGFVTSAVASPAMGTVLAMGYVHRDFVEAGTALGIDRGGDRLPAVVTQPR